LEVAQAVQPATYEPIQEVSSDVLHAGLDLSFRLCAVAIFTAVLVILAVAILLFGPKKLPELGKGLGEGIRGFKKAMTEQNKEK